MQKIPERHLAEAREALAQCDRQRTILQEEVAALETIITKTPEERIQPAREEHHPSQARDGSRYTLYGSKRDRMETAIERFLRENSQPMHRIQIKDHLLELGIVGEERDPLAHVSSVLSASPRFISVSNGLWTLKTDSADR